MKRALLAAILLLGLPSVAQAKEFTGLAVCGPDGCKATELGGFGHEPPFAGGRQQPPPPGPFYRLDFEIDGAQGAWVAYYEPASGLAAFEEGVAAGMTWTRLDAAIAEAVKETASDVEPFPSPPVPEVRIGSRKVTDDATTWLRLFAVRGASEPPKGGAEVIRFISPKPSPWTAKSFLYFPANDVLQTGSGRFVKLPAEMAADVEAARPLGAGGDGRSRWAVLAAALAGALLLVGGGLLFYRTRMSRAAVTALFVALVVAGPAAAKPQAVALKVCGPEGCTQAQPPDLGHDPPLRILSHVPPARPAPYHTAEVTFDFGEALRVYYIAAANAFAALDAGEWRPWYAGDGPLGEAVRKAAEVTRPFPAPPLSATERALVELARPVRMPLTGRWITLRLRADGPWKDAVLGYYYPAADVLCRPYSTCVRVPRPLAAELERASSPKSRIHWAIAMPAIAAALAALLAAFRRRRAAATMTVVAALAFAPSAAAKFRMTLALSDPTPRTGQAVRVVLRADADPGDDAEMRLVAVPPRIGMYAAIRAEPLFNVRLRRDGATWRGTVRFNRPGRWLLVVPNWGAPGYAIPPPVVRTMRVSR